MPDACEQRICHAHIFRMNVGGQLAKVLRTVLHRVGIAFQAAFCAEFTALPYGRRTCARPKLDSLARRRDAPRHMVTKMGRVCLHRATEEVSDFSRMQARRLAAVLD